MKSERTGIAFCGITVAALILASSVADGKTAQECDAKVGKCNEKVLSEFPFSASSAPKDVWTSALFATGAISTLGNIGIVIYMCMDTRSGSGWGLKTMIAFAVGGLLGDVFIHLLPHAAAGGNPHDPKIPLCTLAGIFFFFLIEKVVRMFTGSNHSHSHSKDAKGADEDEDDVNNHTTGIRPGAVLNMFADTAHNFVDGLALATAFRASKVLGLSTTLSVFVHEIPHEMGDFAILLSQGCSKKAAFLCQFVSALGAFAGCLFGLWISMNEEDTRTILAFTAGNFIYVALVDVLPEILRKSTSPLQLVREVIAIALGIAVMVLVAKLEENDPGLTLQIFSSMTGGSAQQQQGRGNHAHSHSHAHAHSHGGHGHAH
jgi:zinc transporter 7